MEDKHPIMLYVGAMKVWRILKKSHGDYQQEKLPRFGDEVVRKQLVAFRNK